MHVNGNSANLVGEWGAGGRWTETFERLQIQEALSNWFEEVTFGSTERSCLLIEWSRIQRNFGKSEES